MIFRNHNNMLICCSWVIYSTNIIQYIIFQSLCLCSDGPASVFPLLSAGSLRPQACKRLSASACLATAGSAERHRSCPADSDHADPKTTPHTHTHTHTHTLHLLNNTRLNHTIRASPGVWTRTRTSAHHNTPHRSDTAHNSWWMNVPSPAPVWFWAIRSSPDTWVWIGNRRSKYNLH